MHHLHWSASDLFKRDDPDDGARMRFVTLFSCALAFWGPVYAAVYFYLDAPINAAALVVATMLVAGVPLILRTTGSAWLASMYILVDYVGVLTLLSCRLGGYGAPTLDWLAIVPMMAVMLTGGGSALVWTLIVAADLTAFYMLDVWNVPLPVAVSADGMQLLNLISLVGLSGSLLSLALVYQLYRNWTTRLLKYYATHDPLTGMLNRGAVLGILQQELRRSQRTGKPVSVMLADLDYFKTINDRFGHLVGDDVLRDVARRIEQTLRPYDRFGRFGGEEFLIVIPECSRDAALAAAERVRRALDEEPVEFENGSIPVTISIGVASTQDGADAMSLLGAADRMLYRAKGQGRNRVELSRPHAPIDPDNGTSTEPVLAGNGW